MSPAKQEKNFIRCKPNYITKLVELMSAKEVSVLLGRSSTAINGWVNADEAPLDAETAARYHYELRTGKGTSSVAIITGSKENLALIKAMIESAGGKFLLVP